MGKLAYRFLNLRHKYFRDNKFGFTLIELIVTISITIIIGGAGIFSYVKYSETQILEKEVLEFKQIFERARFNAVSFVKPVSCVDLDVSVEGFWVFVDSANKQVKLSVLCGDNSEHQELLTTFTSTISQTSGSCKTFYFETLSNNVSCVGDSFSPLPVFRLQQGTSAKDLQIQTSGTIKIL